MSYGVGVRVEGSGLREVWALVSGNVATRRTPKIHKSWGERVQKVVQDYFLHLLCLIFQGREVSS